MSLAKTIRVVSKIAREIDKANKRAQREHEKRGRELELARRRTLAEEERFRKELSREEKRRQKEGEIAAFEEEKRIFEERLLGRKQLRLDLINKIRK